MSIDFNYRFVKKNNNGTNLKNKQMYNKKERKEKTTKKEKTQMKKTSLPPSCTMGDERGAGGLGCTDEKLNNLSFFNCPWCQNYSAILLSYPTLIHSYYFFLFCFVLLKMFLSLSLSLMQSVHT